MSSHQPASLGAAALRPLREPMQLNWAPWNTLAMVLSVIGLAGFVIALILGRSQRVWEIWLVNFLFFNGVAQGGVVCSAAFYLTQARWAGTTHYRMAEAFSLYLVVGFVMFWGIFIGRISIFPWILHPSPKQQLWLNVPFLFARDGIALLVMTIISLWFVLIIPPPRSPLVGWPIRRNRHAAGSDSATRTGCGDPLLRDLFPAGVRSDHVAIAEMAQYTVRVVVFRDRFLERDGRNGADGSHVPACPWPQHDRIGPWSSPRYRQADICVFYLLDLHRVCAVFGDLVRRYSNRNVLYRAALLASSMDIYVLVRPGSDMGIPFLVLLGVRPKRTPGILGTVSRLV